MQNLETQNQDRLFLDAKLQTETRCPFPFLPSQILRCPPLVHLSPKLTGKGICCKVSEFECGAKRQRHGDKSCWGHPYLWKWQRIRLRDRVWSHLMMAKKLLSTWWILFCIGPIFRYHEFLSEFVSENLSFLLLLLLRATLLPTLATLSPPLLHVILLLPKAKYRYKTYDKL